MAAKVALSGRKRRVFESVFPSTLSTISQATSVQPPLSQSTNLSQVPGGYQNPSTSFSTQSSFQDLDEDPVRQQEAWDNAWHTVTAFLSIKKTTKIPLQHMFLDRIINDEEFKAKIFTVPDAEFETALIVLLEPQKHLPMAGSTEDIVVWYTQETRRHFLHVIIPHLFRVCNGDFVLDPHGHLRDEQIVSQSLKTLEGAHRLYHHGLSFITRTFDAINPDGNSKLIIMKYRRDLHAVVSNWVSKRLLVSLKTTLFVKMCVAVGMPERTANSPWPESQDALPRPNKGQRQEARRELISLVDSLNSVGLGGERFQIVFAELMNECMNDFVQRAFSGAWSRQLVYRVVRGFSKNSLKGDLEAAQTLSLLSTELRTGKAGLFAPSTEPGQYQIRRSLDVTVLPRMINQSSESQCITELCEWIENVYARLAVEVFHSLGNLTVSWSDVEKWKEMGIGRLAELRTSELFDIVCNWPESLPALVDLRTAVTTPQQRLKLTDAFSAALQERLLHPGSSTLQILRTYISMIWSFHALDHSKVLLDRVAYPLQLYLCSREDTVRIIITGLLSDTEDPDGNPIQPGGEKLAELALIMNGTEHPSSDYIRHHVDIEEMDWHDMEWVPDPVDAGPGYKRSKTADIIGTLIGVLGSQEVFIKEFQNIVGENLLKHEGEFLKEMKVLELLKSRFGESPLQSCEVMIKDIYDSRISDTLIRKNQDLAPSTEELEAVPDIEDDDHSAAAEGLLKPSLHAKILSRLFWPQLHDESYRVPTQIAALQDRYSTGFENLKASRKLTWLHALGQATVELDLEDRVVFEEVFTWQATVIWAFEGEPIGGEAVSRTVPALVEYLEMDESLVRSALSFWVGKLVLYEVRKDEYAVLETLNAEDRERSKNGAGQAAMDEDSEGAGESGHSQQGPQERLKAYWPMIQGMLMNTMPQMPLQQIAMMLKMVVDGGFPYSNEELQEFLQGCVSEGKLEVGAGGRYKLKK